MSRCLRLFPAIFLMFMANTALCELRQCKGQTVYVPIYSHIYHGDQQKHPFYLTATLSIRNTDPDHPITVAIADYYDSDGKLLKNYLPKPLKLNPLSSTYVIIQESDKSGGVGASFIVRWESENKVSEPLIEAVMIGAKGQQGISFTSRGQVIRQTY